MKKRIIFMGLCLMLLLVFTSLSYGEYDPKYKVKADPWSDLLKSHSADTSGVDVLILWTGPGTALTFLLNCATSRNASSNELNWNRAKWIHNRPERLPERPPQQ